MRHWGYDDARAQPGGADGGVDVVSGRALGQVKYQASAVGRPELQRLFGARGLDMGKQLLFFTGSSYAATAVDYANKNSIALFVYALDGTMKAINPIARQISAPPSPAISVPVQADMRKAPSKQSGLNARQGVIIFLTVVALGGVVSAVEGLTGYSPHRATGNAADSASAIPPAQAAAAFKAYAAEHGSLEQKAAVNHVSTITETVQPISGFAVVNIYTDLGRFSDNFDEGQLVSSLFSEYRGGRKHGTLTVYNGDRAPLAYGSY